MRFCVYSYQKDKKLHPRLWGDGNVKEYIVNPYQMVVTNGRYYLIGNIDKFDNIAHFRIDRIKGIKIVEDSVRKKYTESPEMKDGFQLGKHMAEHVYMFSGKSERVQFIAKTYLYNDLMDWFGDDLRFIKEENNEVLCEVSVNLKSMKRNVTSCWDKNTKKFVKADGIEDHIFKNIEASKSGMKLKNIGKSALKGAGIGFGVALVLGGILKFLQNRNRQA